VQKICTICGEERDAEKDFNWKYSARGIRQTRCKACQSQVGKQHYKNNKQSYLDRARIRGNQVIADNQSRLSAHLASHPCIDCGHTDIRILEFDHVRGNKSGHVSRMVGLGYSWTTIEAELAKCDVRCANCHRIKTSTQSGFWRSQMY